MNTFFRLKITDWSFWPITGLIKPECASAVLQDLSTDYFIRYTFFLNNWKKRNSGSPTRYQVVRPLTPLPPSV